VIQVFNDGGKCSLDDAADAYHLSGWVKIHGDNHSGAYQVWSEGHIKIPSCPVLNK
jgi:hypothetical protein